MLKTCLNCGVEFEGSPQSRFHSDACRKAYGRREPGQPETPEPGQTEPAREVGQRVPSITLEAYVTQIRNEALAYSKQIGETNEAVPIPGTKEFVVNRRRDRLKRAERYARWRYAGFLTGECASL